MNIVVWFNILPDFDQISVTEWLNFDLNNLNLENISNIINLYDEAALENALRIKDVNPKAHITAITMCNTEVDHLIIKNLLSVNVDEVVVINGNEKSAVSSIIKEYCDKAEYVFMGKLSADNMDQSIPYKLASLINFKLVANVVSLIWDEDNFRVKRQIMGGYEIVPIEKNTLITISEAEYSYLRMSTLREKLRSKSREPIVINVKKEILKDEVVYSYGMKKRECKYLKCVELEDDVKEIYDFLVGEQ